MSVIHKRAVPYLILYIFLYLYHLVITLYPGDDIKYSQLSNSYTLLDWLSYRYFNWSGRMFPDALAYLLLDNEVWLWRLLNPLVLIILSYSIIRLIKKNVSFKDVIVAFLLVGFFAQNVLSSGVFWITGSLNYLWPITFAVIAMIPFADRVFKNESIENKVSFYIYLILGFLSSFGNEQVALCMSCFSVISLIYLYIRNKIIDKKLIIISGIILLGTSILLLAPGNQIRWVKEVNFWFPGFDHLSIKDHFYIGIIWMYGELFNDMKYLVLLLSFIVILISFKHPLLQKNWLSMIFTILFGAIIYLHITGYYFENLYNFSYIKEFRLTESLFTMKIDLQFFIALLPYIFWTVYSLLLMYLILKISKNKIFMFLCIAASVATLGVMFFSPTIYGSGNRVLTVASVIISIIVCQLIINNKLNQNRGLVLIIGSFSIINLVICYYKWSLTGFNPFL